MPRTSFKLTLVATLAVVSGSAPAATPAIWDGATAVWSDASHWSTTPAFPNNSGPTTYDATINAGVVTLNQAITIQRLTLGGSGALDGASSLTALDGLAWTGGAIRGSGTLTLGSGIATTITGGAQPLVLSERTVNFSGTTNFTTGTIRGGSGAILNNAAGATFTAIGNAAFFADPASPLYTFGNAGIFVARSTTGAGFTSMDARFNNAGTVRLELAGSATAHTLSLAGGGIHSGTFQLAAGTAVELGGATTLQAGAAFTGAGTAFVAGSVTLTGNVAAENLAVAVGELNVGANVLSAGISGTQTGGATRLGTGGTLRVAAGAGTWLLDDGTLTGAGTLDASLDAQGDIAPGNMLGTLAITGDAFLGTDARVVSEIGGATAGLFDVLAVAGAVALDGELHLTLANGFTPTAEDTFTILTGSVITGTFANAPIDGFRLNTTDGKGSFAIDYTANSVVLLAYVPEPAAATLTLLGFALAGARRMRRVPPH